MRSAELKKSMCPGEFDNHVVLQVAVRPGSQQAQATIHKAPNSFAQQFEDECENAAKDLGNKDAEAIRATLNKGSRCH